MKKKCLFALFAILFISGIFTPVFAQSDDSATDSETSSESDFNGADDYNPDDHQYEPDTWEDEGWPVSEEEAGCYLGDWDMINGGKGEDDENSGSDSYDEETVQELAKDLQEARAALSELYNELDFDKTLSVEDQARLDACYAAANTARAALDSYCNSHNLLYDESTNSDQVKVSHYEPVGEISPGNAPEIKPVFTVGDPVMVASGFFVIDDSDLSIGGVACSFAVKRHFTSDSRTLSHTGFFGTGWTSNLESRIIACSGENSDLSFEAPERDIEALEEQVEKLQKYLSEKSEETVSVKFARKMLDRRLFQLAELKTRLGILSGKGLKTEKSVWGLPGELSKDLGFSSVIFVNDKGGPVLFTQAGDGTFIPSDKKRARGISLCLQADGTYLVSFKSGEKRIYNQDGLLSELEVKSGGKISFEYENGLLSDVKLSGGRKISFVWENSMLSQVKSCGLVWKYGYENGRLSSVIDSDGNERKFVYDSEGNLVRQVKGDGTFVSFAYEKGTDGVLRTVSTTDENGATEYFSYDLEASSTIYTDKDGIKSTFFWRGDGLISKNAYATGLENSFVYDDEGNIVESSSLSEKIQYSYDSDGNLTQKIYSDGTGEYFSYSDGNLTSYTDRDGVVSTFTYNGAGLRSGIYIGGKILYSFSYNSSNLLDSLTDCRGNKKLYSYDKNGDLVKIEYLPVNGGRGLQLFEYDESGRLKKFTDVDGLESTYSYSPNKIVVKSSSGLESLYLYSSRKTLLSVVQKDLISGAEVTFRYEYDKCKNPVKVSLSGTLSDGKKVHEYTKETMEYTAQGKVRKIRIWSGEKPAFEKIFDYSPVDGSLLKVESGYLDLFGKFKDGQKSEKVFSYEYKDRGLSLVSEFKGLSQKIDYDSFGRLIGLSKNGASVLKNEFTAGGRLSRMVVGPSSSYSYDYDSLSGTMLSFGEEKSSVQKDYFDFLPDGCLSESRGKDGNKKIYEYTIDGKILSVKDNISVIENSYDSAFRLVKSTVKNNDGRLVKSFGLDYSEDGKKITVRQGGLYEKTYEFDSFGRCVKISDATGASTAFFYDIEGKLVKKTGPSGIRVNYDYDCLGRLSSEDKAGQKVDYSYDAEGNLTCVKDSAGTIFKAGYNGDGKMISLFERPSSAEKTFSYDDFGRLIHYSVDGKLVLKNSYDDDSSKISSFDGLGNEYLYSFDSYGRKKGEKNRLKDSSTNEYDSAGRLVSSVDFNGKKSIYSYDSAGRLQKISYDNGTFSSYEYDAAGNLTKAKNQNQTLIFTYDLSGRLVSQTDGIDTVKFYYDKAGRLVKKVTDKNSYIYSYRPDSLVASVSLLNSAGGQIEKVSFSYDGAGRESKREWKQGQALYSYYDDAGRLILQKCNNSENKLVFLRGLVYDDYGRISITINSSLSLTRYEYDQSGELTRVISPYSQKYSGFLKNLCAKAGLHFLSGGESNSYLSFSSGEKSALEKIEDLLGSGYKVQTMEPHIEEGFSYDGNGNCIERVTPYGTIKYKYDSENRLISAGDAVTFEYDKNGNMLFKKDRYGQVTMDYSPENRLIYAECQSLSDGKNVFSYEYDALGKRSLSKETDGSVFKSVYDGFSMNELYSKKIEDVFYSSVENLRSSDTTASENYRYLFSGSEKNRINGKNTGIASASFGSVNLFLGNRLLAQADYAGSAESKSFFTDSAGTVFAGLSQNENMEYSYDIFGNPIDESLPARGFVGKKYNAFTGLYDFSYRDYNPDSMRFTSVDPIRDGQNWYAYCPGDPVNYVDVNGLEQTPEQKWFVNEIVEGVKSGRLDAEDVKAHTEIAIERSDLDDGENGHYFQSREIVLVYGTPVNSIPVQSTADYTSYVERGDGRTIPPGTYEGVLSSVSPTYENSICLSGMDVKAEERMLLHPNCKTKLGETEEYFNGTRPYSGGCQISHLSDFNEVTKILESLGFVYNDTEKITVSIFDSPKNYSASQNIEKEY